MPNAKKKRRKLKTRLKGRMFKTQAEVEEFIREQDRRLEELRKINLKIEKRRKRKEERAKWVAKHTDLKKRVTENIIRYLKEKGKRPSPKQVAYIVKDAAVKIQKRSFAGDVSWVKYDDAYQRLYNHALANAKRRWKVK